MRNLWPLAATVGGIVVAWSAQQGWLGYRLWSRPRALMAGLLTSLAILTLGPSVAALAHLYGWLLTALIVVAGAIVGRNAWNSSRYRHPSAAALSAVALVAWLASPMSRHLVLTILALLLVAFIARTAVRRVVA